MGTFTRIFSILLLTSGTWLPAGAQTTGDPFVFVSETEEDGTKVQAASLTWYLLPMKIRTTGSAVSGVRISAINSFLKRQSASRPAITPDQWCFANALSDHSYVSANRIVQANIDQSFRTNGEHRFQLRGRFTGTSELLATVGHYEDCAGKTHSFILITDNSGTTPAIVHVDTLPYVGGLQYMRLVDGKITVSTCFECGDVAGLFYDPVNRRWYWEALGD